MSNYTDMPTAVLVDLLASETAKVTQLLADKMFNDEYEKAKNNIQQIQAVIESRKSNLISNSDTSISQQEPAV